MKRGKAHQVKPIRVVSWWAGFVSVSLYLYVFTSSGISQAAGFTSPKECESFAGDDHLNCLYSYIERQQQHNDTIEFQRKTQQDMLERSSTPLTGSDEPAARTDTPTGAIWDPNDRRQTVPAPPYRSESITPATGSPPECRAYSGAAHLNCLYAYIDIQNSKAGSLADELKTQKDMLSQLREQVDRQGAASQDLQRTLAEREALSSLSFSPYVAPPIYPGYGYPGYGYLGYGYPGFGYGYRAPGLSLYLGVPGYYWGRPFYGPRFFGPRFYGHHRR